MKIKEMTDAELLVLGLVAEVPRHGYQLEQVIKQRGMREWTQIGFSSIYFVLGKLETLAMVGAKKPTEPKAKKIYSATEAGRDALATQSLAALKNIRRTYSSVLLGMVHWPVLQRDQALHALRSRGASIEKELSRIETKRLEQQPLPEFVEALFDYSLSQLKAEAQWITRTLDNMETKS